MDQEFSTTRQTTESKSRRSSFRMEKGDIWDPTRFGVRAHPVCAVHQRSTTGSGISIALFADDTKVFREISNQMRTGRSCSKTLMN